MRKLRLALRKWYNTFIHNVSFEIGYDSALDDILDISKLTVLEDENGDKQILYSFNLVDYNNIKDLRKKEIKE